MKKLSSNFSVQSGLAWGSVILSLGLASGCSSLKTWVANIAPETEFKQTEKEFRIKKLWVRKTPLAENEGYRKINRMSPLIAGDLLIQGNSLDGISAFKASNGQRVWHKPLSQGVEASGVIANGRVYLATSDGSVMAITASDGEILWTVSTKSENTAPPSYDPQSKSLFVLAGNNSIHSLDAETGKTHWIYTRQDTSSLSIRGGTLPVLSEGLLFVGFSEGSFVALNAKSGTVAWEISLNKNKRFRDIEAGAVIDKDRIYVSGFDDKLYALSTKGEIQWRLNEGGYSPVKIENGRIFYPTTSGKVLCLDQGTGNVIWTYSLKDGMATEIRLYKGLVVFGESQGNVVFLSSQTGQKVGSFEPGRGVMATPSLDEKKSRVYFISGEANLYALEAQWSEKRHFEYLQ